MLPRERRLVLVRLRELRGRLTRKDRKRKARELHFTPSAMAYGRPSLTTVRRRRACLQVPCSVVGACHSSEAAKRPGTHRQVGKMRNRHHPGRELSSRGDDRCFSLRHGFELKQTDRNGFRCVKISLFQFKSVLEFTPCVLSVGLRALSGCSRFLEITPLALRDPNSANRRRHDVVTEAGNQRSSFRDRRPNRRQR